MDNSGWEGYSTLSSSSPSKRINKIKKIFRSDVLFKRPGPFDGAKVLKTRDGIIALTIYIFTGWFTTSLLVSFIGLNNGIASNEDFFILLLVSIFISPIAAAFAYTAPLENALSLGLRKYLAYLAYNILILLITFALIGLMIGLTAIGLCLGLVIGVALMFYILYRLFLAPGIIAVANESPIDALGESVELTRGWEGIWLFIVYFIVIFIINYLDKYLIKMVFDGYMEALIMIIILNIPLFIIYVSITLFVASFHRYLDGALGTRNDAISDTH